MKFSIEPIKHLFSPPHLGDHDSGQRKIILQTSASLVLAAGLYFGFINAQAGFVVLSFSLFLLAIIGAFSLWSVRRGQLGLPSFLIPLGALFVLGANSFEGGTLEESDALLYAVLIVFASLLLGKGAALLFAGLGILAQTILYILFSIGSIEVADDQFALSSLIITALLIGILAVFLWIMLDSLEYSIKRAQTSEERWRLLAENAPVTIINTDSEGIVQFFNHFGEVQSEDIIGKPLLAFVPITDQKRAIAATRRVLRSGKSVHFEASGRGLEDRELFFSVSVGPLFNPNQEIEGLTFIILDITEKKWDEDKIRQLNAELEALLQERTTQLDTSNQELAALSYSVSHDLRTPLRAIDGFSLALLEDYQGSLDDQGRDYLKRVRAASQRMGTLIDDLLRLASIARQEYQSKMVDLSLLAKRVANSFSDTDPERLVEIKIKPGLLVQGDENLLHIAVSNLFGNAWAFTRHRKDAQIEFGCQEINGLFAYFIRDNGVGFDMRYAAKLFQPFQTLHGRSELEGSGIGLAIVQRIIHKHGGKIWADARENQGATFYFTLPFSEKSDDSRTN
jgi:PAS domain S-box-containing protein